MVFQMYAIPVPKTPRSASAPSETGVNVGWVSMSAARMGEATSATAAAVVTCTVETVRLS
jgi:hypothetical protein